MKARTIIGACVAAAPLITTAQSNVTLYGLVDSGVAVVNNVGKEKKSMVFMPNISGSFPSRWGLRGSEDLGGGNKAVFVLESGFGPDSGTLNQGGRMFGRQAFVGISSSWGLFSAGRQYTMLYHSVLDTELLGSNLFGPGSFDPYLPNARADNALAYKGTFGALTLGGTFSFGRDTVSLGPGPAGTNCGGENGSDKKACREWSALVAYDANLWKISVAYDSLRGGAGAYGLTSSSLTDDRLLVSANVKVGQGKVVAGWLRRDNEAGDKPVNDVFWLGTSFPVSNALTIDVEALHQRYHNSDDKAWVFAGKATYALSKRTSLYGTAGYIKNSSNLALSINAGQAGTNPAPGQNQIGFMAGIKHSF